MNTIGDRMKLIRKEEGLKQSDFADRVLVSASYISKVESNKEIPSEIFTKLVSLEFHISYAWLKDGSGDMHIKKDEYDYFERNVEKAIENTSEDIKELNQTFKTLLQNNRSFRELCISSICNDLSKIMRYEISESQKDLLIEILADYIGSIEELTEKLYNTRNMGDYYEKNSFYIASSIKEVERYFNNLQQLIFEYNN